MKLHADHYKKRKEDRKIDAKVENIIKNFDIQKWKLVTAEVRKDKGKFINSTWEKVINEEKIWIVIGFNDTVETVIKKSSDGKGESIMKEGELYEYVEKVNKELMEES
mgnify:CR=1 FL=1